MTLSADVSPTDAGIDVSERDVFTILFRMPSKAEHKAMAGSTAEAICDKWLPPNLNIKQVEAVRNMLWELRVSLAKAAHACTVCPDFWLIPEAMDWLATLTESL